MSGSSFLDIAQKLKQQEKKILDIIKISLIFAANETIKKPKR